MPVAIVAHDAGAANLIIAWVAEAGLESGARVCVAGPAAALWQSRFGQTNRVPDPAIALDGARTLLSGTGWASDLEHDARRAARQLGIPSVAVLDHWVNYRMRFERNGDVVLPDRIWVTDGYALDAARDSFPDVPVELRPNPYLATQAVAAGPVPDDGDVLFVAEPARASWGRELPGEIQTLDFLAAHGARAGIAPETPIRIRPHPSDPPGKFDEWVAAHPGALIDTSGDLGSAMTRARYVAGLNSYALVVALHAGRETICALPPWAPPCLLPHKGIRHLARMVDDQPSISV